MVFCHAGMSFSPLGFRGGLVGTSAFMPKELPPRGLQNSPRRVLGTYLHQIFAF
jgi:hypothetical protein